MTTTAVTRIEQSVLLVIERTRASRQLVSVGFTLRATQLRQFMPLVWLDRAIETMAVLFNNS